VRVLAFTGKGGVGKTTTAAATAVACASRGARTLVLSTDAAHSLADALDVALGDRPTLVTAGLWGQQLDARARLEAGWGDIRGYLARLLDWAGVAAVEAEELTLIPGLDEMLALTDLVDLVTAGDYDVIVVDCAPTAETLRLLSLPGVLSWWMERLFPIGRRLTRLVGPVVEQLAGVPTPSDPVFVAVERLHHRLQEVRALLADPERTSVRLVVTPERVVVAEARRTATYLALFGYGVDAVVANRLLPDEVTDPWFDEWRVAQAQQLGEIESGFAPLPVLRAPLASAEPIGVEALAIHAKALYGDTDPAQRRHHGTVLDLEADGDRFVLSLDLPFAVKGEVDLVRRPDELICTVGPYRRALVLPDSLRPRRVVDAALRDGRLRVAFA
jgi:arsenite/tail-anchored protein-transporting ATPase